MRACVDECSAWPDEIEVTTAVAAPAAPAGFAFTNATTNTISFSWNADASADNYEVQREGANAVVWANASYTWSGLAESNVGTGGRGNASTAPGGTATGADDFLATNGGNGGARGGGNSSGHGGGGDGSSYASGITGLVHGASGLDEGRVCISWHGDATCGAATPFIP